MKLADRNNSRRNFLLGVGAGGAAATVALVGRRVGEGKPTREPKETAPSGYRVTEHIRKYYDTAKV